MRRWKSRRRSSWTIKSSGVRHFELWRCPAQAQRVRSRVTLSHAIRSICHEKHIVLLVSKITVADLKKSTNAKVNVELALPNGLINVSSN